MQHPPPKYRQPSRFQSSTRQTDFATVAPASRQAIPPRVSILYEADRLCNLKEAWKAGKVPFVSILYEADRLCNGGRAGSPLPVPTVSILYEADRLCNSRG